MDLNIGDVTKSIGEREKTVTDNLSEIRELLKQLEITRKPIQNGDTLDSNLQASDEEYIYDPNDNSAFNNSSSESGLGSGNNAKSNVIPSQIENQFDPSVKYTPIQIQQYHDLASNEASSEELYPEEKYNIIINAEKRLDYLKRKKNTSSDEYKELNEIFEKCKNSGFCQKIKSMWNDIQERNELNDTTNIASTPTTANVRPRSAVRAWKGGIKTRKRIHRKTKRRRTNKKSRTHKKRH